MFTARHHDLLRRTHLLISKYTDADVGVYAGTRGSTNSLTG